MNDSDLSLDTLLQETLALTEYLRANSGKDLVPDYQSSFLQEEDPVLAPLDHDYLYDLADGLIQEGVHTEKKESVSADADQSESLIACALPDCAAQVELYPQTAGIVYKLDNAASTFCVRGFSVNNIREAFSELRSKSSVKRVLLKLEQDSALDEINFFETKNFELAEAIREQVINRRFPHQEDALCNLSDPGFSWWLNIDNENDQGRLEIFFRSHGINRAEKYIQLGPIGDGTVAALRMNQARTLLRSSFPITEYSCDEKSFTIATSKPDHSSFVSFKNIFLNGINHTELENFPDNGIGRTLFYYFHELAIVRKFWIEVKSKLG